MMHGATRLLGLVHPPVLVQTCYVVLQFLLDAAEGSCLHVNDNGPL